MKYDVYGIGNALVDTEFEIEDDFLKEFSIEKGMMTLVDREQQDQSPLAQSPCSAWHSESARTSEYKVNRQNKE